MQRRKSKNTTANFDMADEIAAPAAEIAMEEGDDDALDMLDDYADIFRATVLKIDEDEGAGILDPEDAEDLRVQAIEDYEDLIADLLGVEMEEDEYSTSDYANNSALAQFNAGNSFGAALLQLAQDEFENPDDAIYAIAEHTGYQPEEILGLISGEYVPDDQLASEIAEVFETTADDDDAYNGLLVLGQEAREEGVGSREQGVGEEEGEEGEEGEEESSENFSRYLADKDRRIQNLEAEFSQAKNERYVSETLMELEQQAYLGVQEGWFPPVAYREVFANFRTDADKLAAFSSVCEGNGVDVETELYATQKLLSLFERCGPFITFGASVEEQLTPEEWNESEVIVSQAERNVQLRKERNGQRAKPAVSSE